MSETSSPEIELKAKFVKELVKAPGTIPATTTQLSLEPSGGQNLNHRIIK